MSQIIENAISGMKIPSEPLFLIRDDPEQFPDGGYLTCSGYAILFGNGDIAKVGKKIFSNIADCARVARKIVKSGRYPMAQIAQLRSYYDSPGRPWWHNTHCYSINNGKFTISRMFRLRQVVKSYPLD